jgi:hypothetical protein
MSDKPYELFRIQRWMQAVITHPSGIGAGIASEAARQDFDIAFEDVEKIVSRSEALTGAERLMIYSRSYHARLRECFRAEFPCVLHALGDGLFTDFVIEYLKYYPPRSYTLHDVAKSFPQFLAETRPDASAPSGERETWPDFIIDLATLERAFIEVFDGPGSEGQSLARAGQITALDDERFAQLRLAAVPCLRLLAFRYPVLAYFNAVREKKAPKMPVASDTFLAVNRMNYRIQFSTLSLAQYSVLASLMSGLSVSSAAGVTGYDHKRIRTWLSAWADSGFFLQASSNELKNN